MLLTAPEPTPYDLRFRALGIPVRIHPGFWIASALLGGIGIDNGSIAPTLIWIACVFVSILVHEFGHALAYRACGQWPRVVLYHMGGLAIGTEEERRPWRRLGIILAGPGAGLALLVVILIGSGLLLRIPPGDLLAICGQMLGRNWPIGHQTAAYALAHPMAFDAFYDLIYINLFWTLINLLPVFPLDGGQAAGVVLTMFNRRGGQYWMHVVSLVTAGIIAVYFLMKADFRSLGSIYPALLFGMLALNNYQILHFLRHQSRFGSFGEDAEDWWRH